MRADIVQENFFIRTEKHLPKRFANRNRTRSYGNDENQS